MKAWRSGVRAAAEEAAAEGTLAAEASGAGGGSETGSALDARL